MPSSHRFQSRLFQTLQAKFYQLQDTVQLHWRQLKVAAVWSAQLSLYPLQAVFQAGRWSGRMLKQQLAKQMRSLSVTLGLGESAAVDQPIQNVLAAFDIQTLSVLTSTEQDPQASVLSTEMLLSDVKQYQLSIQPVATQKLSFVEKCGRLWQKWRGATQRSSATVPASSTLNIALAQMPGAEPSPIAGSQTVTIQGVASSLCHRHLVLVTSGNQILDILTVEQQRQLHQRIIFEIAVALRLHRRLGASASSLPQTSPLALLKGAWKQMQQSARSVFLPPSTAVACLLGLGTGSEVYSEPHLETAASPSWIAQIASQLKSLRGSIIVALSAVALAPFTLALPARAAMAPTLPQPLPSAPFAAEWMIDPARTRRQWLRGTDLFGQSKPIQGKIRLVPEKAPAVLAAVPFQTAVADWADRWSQSIPSSGCPPIDVNADFVGYHLHPLQRLLIVLDQMMVWLETQILWLWRQGKSVIHRLFS